MKEVKNWKKEFVTVVSELAGYSVREEDIHSDKVGWHYYIPAKSMQEGRPLFLIHYRGPAFIVIPYKEFEALENGDINPEDYIENSRWCFGYYWGGGSMIGGSFWQPLESGKGIHDTAKISRYLNILSCRTRKRIAGATPTAEQCKNCFAQGCPIQIMGVFASEIPEVDYRVKLFKALSERAEKKLGVKLKGLVCSDLPEHTVIITPDYKGTCCVTIPKKLNVELLNNPDKFAEIDWKDFSKQFNFELRYADKSYSLETREQVKEILEAIGILKEWKKISLKKKVIDLESSLVEAHGRVINLRMEIEATKKEIAELEEDGKKKTKEEKKNKISFFQKLKCKLGF